MVLSAEVSLGTAAIFVFAILATVPMALIVALVSGDEGNWAAGVAGVLPFRLAAKGDMLPPGALISLIGNVEGLAVKYEMVLSSVLTPRIPRVASGTVDNRSWPACEDFSASDSEGGTGKDGGGGFIGLLLEREYPRVLPSLLPSRMPTESVGRFSVTRAVS